MLAISRLQIYTPVSLEICDICNRYNWHREPFPTISVAVETLSDGDEGIGLTEEPPDGLHGGGGEIGGIGPIRIDTGIDLRHHDRLGGHNFSTA